MLVLALSQIYTSVFHLWKSIDLDSAWVRYSFPRQFSPACSRTLSEAAHLLLDAGIPNFAYLAF